MCSAQVDRLPMYDVCLLLFCVLLVYGSVCDVMTFEIPNFVSIAGGLLFFPAALFVQLELGVIALHLLAGALALGAGFSLFVANILGGGDVKILSAVALWTGLHDLLPLLFCMALIGGLLALLLLLFRRFRLPRRAHNLGWLASLHAQKGVPYSVAIVLAALLSFSGSW